METKIGEQGGRLNGDPRHASCFLATLGAGVAPRAAVSHLGRSLRINAVCTISATTYQS